MIAGVLLFGRVSDGLGRRPVLLAGLALSAISAVCFLLADGLVVRLGLFTAVSPAFLAQGLSVKSHAVVGLVVFVVFAASAFGQMMLGRFPDPMSVGCGALIAGMGFLALGLARSSLALLVLAGIAAGLGQGLSFRAGPHSLTEGGPPERRAEVASSFFAVAYLAISVPVIGEGVLADRAGLRTAGLVFAGVVASLAAVTLVLLARSRTADL